MEALQIKITLKDFKPTITRTILVSPDDTFFALHVYIQDLFGFADYHLWNFMYGKQPSDIEITLPNEEFEQLGGTMYDASEKKLKEIFLEDKIIKIDYWYDFWDDWHFDVSFQKIVQIAEKTKLPTLVKAKWNMLREDAGWPYWLREKFDCYEDKAWYEDWFDSFEDLEEYIRPALEDVDWKDFKFSSPKQRLKEYREVKL